jgi:hypothetical protein
MARKGDFQPLFLFLIRFIRVHLWLNSHTLAGVVETDSHDFL